MQEIELLELMLEHQDRLNSRIHPEWREQNFPWHRAIWMECAELMDCFPWKWWAKGETDWDNVKIELADLWHFILSWILQENETKYFLDFLPKIYLSVKPHNNSLIYTHEFAFFACESLAQVALQQRLERCVVYFCSLLRMSHLTLPKLARIYFGKNVLNRFRQNHGLKKGRYSRLWNGVEDNRVMLRLIEDLEVLPLEHFEAELTKRLEAEYAKAKQD